MTNRTMFESKQDLVTAAKESGVFNNWLIEQPAQVGSEDLPLMTIAPGADFVEIELIDTKETCYDGRYEYIIILMFDIKCSEKNVIADRNTFITKFITTAQANSEYPFEIHALRHFPGDWQEFEVWFVEMRVSRYTREDFTS